MNVADIIECLFGVKYTTNSIECSETDCKVEKIYVYILVLCIHIDIVPIEL